MRKTKHHIKKIARDVRILNNQPHRHWHYVYKRARAKRITDDVSTKQIITGQVFTIVASLFAGYILNLQKQNIGLIIGAYILMPGIVDLSASLTGAMAAKINHHLDETPAHPSIIATHAVAFTLTIGLFCGAIVGLFGGIISSLFFEGDMWQLTMLGLVSMMTIIAIGDPIIATLTVVLKKNKLNPDNLMGPIESSIIDVLAIIVIASYARLLA